VVQLYTYII